MIKNYINQYGVHFYFINELVYLKYDIDNSLIFEKLFNSKSEMLKTFNLKNINQISVNQLIDK